MPKIKVFFLNLAGGLGPFGNAEKVLKSKHGENNVFVVDFFSDQQYLVQPNEEDKYVVNDFIGKLPELDEGDSIDHYQIIIASHGYRDKTKKCYFTDFNSQKTSGLFNYQQLSDFFIGMLKKYQPNERVELVFAICYAARSENYDINHIAEIQSVNFETSFAHKFLNDCKKKNNPYPIDLTAYIGIVSFSSHFSSVGQIAVKTEEQDKRLQEINVELENQELDPDQRLSLTQENLKIRMSHGRINYGKITFKARLDRPIEWAFNLDAINGESMTEIESSSTEEGISHIENNANTLSDDEICCSCWCVRKK